MKEGSDTEGVEAGAGWGGKGRSRSGGLEAVWDIPLSHGNGSKEQTSAQTANSSVCLHCSCSSLRDALETLTGRPSVTHGKHG